MLLGVAQKPKINKKINNKVGLKNYSTKGSIFASTPWIQYLAWYLALHGPQAQSDIIGYDPTITKIIIIRVWGYNLHV